jgi:hypothetical protein
MRVMAKKINKLIQKTFKHNYLTFDARTDSMLHKEVARWYD